MNIYVARWHNAKRIADRLKQLINDGWILTWDNETVYQVEITDEDIALWLAPDGHCKVILFVNDPTMDEGCHTKTHEFNADIQTRVGIWQKASLKLFETRKAG